MGVSTQVGASLEKTWAEQSNDLGAVPGAGKPAGQGEPVRAPGLTVPLAPRHRLPGVRSQESVRLGRVTCEFLQTGCWSLTVPSRGQGQDLAGPAARKVSPLNDHLLLCNPRAPLFALAARELKAAVFCSGSQACGTGASPLLHCGFSAVSLTSSGCPGETSPCAFLGTRDP